MVGSRRNMFGFIRSKHRRMMAVRSLDTQDEPFNLSDDDDHGDNHDDENNHQHNHHGTNNYKTETKNATTNHSAHDEDNDDSYLSPDDDDEEDDDDVENKPPNAGTPVGNRKGNTTKVMQLKPTGSTSIGPHQDMIDYFQSESNDVENSQIYFDDNGTPVNGDLHAQFPKMMDHPRFHTNSMDYSRTNSTRNHRTAQFSGDDTSNTMAAANSTRRMGPSGVGVASAGGFGIQTHRDDDDDTCSKTLNTNLEGMHYLQEDHPPDLQNYHPEHSRHQRSYRHHRMVVDHEENIEETPYYYDDDGPVDEFGQPYHHDDLVDEYGQPYPPEEYYYEEDDHHHHGGQEQPMYDEDGRPYYDDGNGMFDAQGQPYFNASGPFFPEHDPYYDDNNTLANSTIATEGFDPPLVERTSWTQPVVKLPSHYDKKHTAKVETFGSVQSASSSDDETRDMSILDEENSDDDDDSESESEDEARSRRSRRSGKKNPPRKSKKKTMRKMIGGMKHCSLKGSSVSYDDDESDDEGTGVTSKMTDSSRSKRSNAVGSRRSNGSRKSDRKSRRNKTSHIDLLFNKASALGQELLEGVADELAPRKRKGKKSNRRRSRHSDDDDDDDSDDDDESDDPATRIVASLRDMFSCGGNSRDYRY